jgi:hypothetical protein
MIEEDFNGNLLDIYWAKNNSVFQIDANFGAVGYIMVRLLLAAVSCGFPPKRPC